MSIGYALSIVLATSSLAQENSAPAPAPNAARLNAGEVAITTTGRGKSTVPAERALMTLNLRCPGRTDAEAQANLESTTTALRRDLLSIGVPRGSIIEGEPTGTLGFVGNEAFSEDMPAELQQAIAKQPRYARTSLTLTLDDLSLLPKVRQMLRNRGAVTLEGPDYELRDDRAARQLAIADAIRRAEADAQAYASSVGMRVKRITGIRDVATTPSVLGDYAKIMERFAGRRSARGAVVETQVNVAADFTLLPR